MTGPGAVATVAKADPRVAAAATVAQRAAPARGDAGGGGPRAGAPAPTPAPAKPSSGKQQQSQRSAPASRPRLPAAPRVVHESAGVVLAVIAWCWIVLPYLRGGTGEVKKVLYAKFLNRTPDGQVLP
jgi:hypothetical protein